NFKTKIRRRPRDVPIPERLPEKMSLQIIGDLGLQMIARLRPLGKKVVQLLQFDKQVSRLTNFGRRTAQRTPRVDQIRRTVVMTANAAIVARLIRRLALRARAAHESVRQKYPRLRIIELLDVARFDQPRIANRPPKLLAERAVLRAVGAA